MLSDIRDREIQSFHALAGNELICTVRKTPTVLYGMFIELLRQFWSGDPAERLFGTPSLTWNPDIRKSTLWIDTEFRWEADHPEARPAIYVKIPPIQYSTINGSSDGLVRRDIQEAEYHYARVGSGQVSFVHISSTSGEACALADSTMDYFDAFSPVITDDFCFNWFKLATRSPKQQLEKDSNEKYGSVVTYDFRFTDSWRLKKETPKLKHLVVRSSEAVRKRLEVGDYWDFKPADGGLGVPPGLTRRVNS